MANPRTHQHTVNDKQYTVRGNPTEFQNRKRELKLETPAAGTVARPHRGDARLQLREHTRSAGRNDLAGDD